MDASSLREILQARVAEVRIDRWGDSGAGCVEFDDGLLRVRGALPGERVRIAVVEETEEATHARVLEVLEPADERRDPLCSRDDVCQGCQLRHAAPPEELDYKTDRVVAAVAERLGVSPAALPVDEPVTLRPFRRGDSHRIRCRLAYRRTENGHELGLTTPATTALIPMTDCPALTTSAQRIVAYVQTALDQLDSPPPGPSESRAGNGDVLLESVRVASPTFGRGLVEVALDSGDRDLAEAVADSALEPFFDDLATRLPDDVGVAARTDDSRTLVSPPDRISLPVAGLTIEAGFRDWLPTTLEPTELLYEYVVDALDLGSDDAFLDVGCGVGTLALLAAETVDHAVGVDRNVDSVEAAELNAIRNDCESVAFRPSGWEKALRQFALDDRTFDAATLHAPGEAVGERPLAYLSSLEIERLVYLTPAPTAGARDLATLQGKGWELERLAAANVHPHTAKAILVAQLGS